MQLFAVVNIFTGKMQANITEPQRKENQYD